MMRALVFVLAMWMSAAGALANPGADEVLRNWYKLTLELVRHTPTYSPPVASRSFAYLGVTAFEVSASGNAEMLTLAGQLNGLGSLPMREADKTYDEAVVLHAAMAATVQHQFSNTGPTGQRAMLKLAEKMRRAVTAGVAADIVARSEAYGLAVAQHMQVWSQNDGGAVIENMGFPVEYALTKGAANWLPTSLVAQQQKPLLPNWGNNRPFAMRQGNSCPLPPPPDYSEDKSSEFYAEALEVVETKNNITAEQIAIARFWSDDPMLSSTPPGHWIAIALQLFEQDNAAISKQVDVLARLGITEADAFIGCWNSKFEYDLLRPVTYIKRVIDPKWETLLNTPPFPEYPSGHSTQSAAAALVLTKAFGDNFAFEDATHVKDGLPPRPFTSFAAAAEEAGISRLYGGIHFRAAIERGLEQGRCIGAFTNALRTTRQ